MTSRILLCCVAFLSLALSKVQAQVNYEDHFFLQAKSIELENSLVKDLGFMPPGKDYGIEIKEYKNTQNTFNEVFQQQQDQQKKWYATDTEKSLIASGALIGLGLYTYKDTGFLNRVDTKEFINRYLPGFENHLDDYTQFIPYIGIYALDAAGVKSKHSTWRKTTTLATSLALNLLVVQTLKYTIAEPRPDGSANNSFPSGHTTTAFMGAHIFHKEYGERSPYYSIGAYVLASITGIFRQLNDRHWSSDVLVGAGLGISLTELAYFLNGKYWKDEGINEIDYENKKPINYNKPAFLGIKASFAQLTTSINDLGLTAKNGFGMDLEGAYFFNKYLGLGGNIGIQSFPTELDPGIRSQLEGAGYDVLLEAVGNSKYTVGPYVQYPFNQGKTTIGANFLIGYSSISDTRIRLAPNQGEISESDIIDFAIFDPKGGPLWTTELYFRQMLSERLYIGLYASYNNINTDLDVSVLKPESLPSNPEYELTEFQDSFHSYNIGGSIGVMIW